MIKVCFNEFDNTAVRMYKDELSDEDEQDGLTFVQKLCFANNQRKIYLALRNKGSNGIKITPLGQDILEFLLEKYMADSSSAYGQAYLSDSKRDLVTKVNAYFNYDSSTLESKIKHLGKTLDILIQLELIEYIDEKVQIKRKDEIREYKKKNKQKFHKNLLDYDVSNYQVIIRLRSCNSYALLLGVKLDQ
jgi:hypothetical protein